MALRIGYFGEPASFSHEAALRRFGSDAFYQPCPILEDAFEALSGDRELVVVPIENASSGVIPGTIDELIRRGGQVVVRECLAMPIKLVLLAGGDLVPSTIYSHNAALTHARAWLRKTFPGAAIVPADSTSYAARKVLEDHQKGLKSAALAGRQAAAQYGLAILRDDVEEEVANRTKFYVLANAAVPNAAATHTALIFEAAHKPGSLAAALAVLAERGINLTMIQSRPIPGRFDEYRFFIEFEAAADSPKGAAALEALRKATHRLDVLGSYPIIDLK